jgi:hypothetical protein
LRRHATIIDAKRLDYQGGGEPVIIQARFSLPCRRKPLVQGRGVHVVPSMFTNRPRRKKSLGRNFRSELTKGRRTWRAEIEKSTSISKAVKTLQVVDSFSKVKRVS